MAHNVERMMSMQDAGQAAPWHINETRERTVLLKEQPASAQEAMAAAGLDWIVETVPVWAETPMTASYDGPFIEVGRSASGEHMHAAATACPMARAVRRVSDGSILSVVGKGWHPVQNATAFDVLDDLVRAGICKYETAGSLQFGRLVWVMMRVNGEQEIVPNDPVNNYLLFWNAHSTEKMPSFSPTQIRVVCNNTLSMAESRAQYALRVRHTKKAEQRVRELADLFGPCLKSFDENVAMFKDLSRFQMTSGTMDEFLTTLFPDPEPRPDAKNKRDPEKLHSAKVRREISDLWVGNMIGGDESLARRFRFTAWTAYNAVCEWIDHRRGRDDCRRYMAWLGAGKNKRSEALELICKLAGVEAPALVRRS